MAEKYLDEVNVGDEITPLTKNIGRYLPIFYAGASGDYNPIHIDPEAGKLAGLGGNILQGLCTNAFCAQVMTDWLGDPGNLKRLKVRMASPVKPGDTVTVKGKIRERDEESGKIVVDIWAENQNGVQVITNAFAEAVLPKR